MKYLSICAWAIWLCSCVSVSEKYPTPKPFHSIENEIESNIRVPVIITNIPSKKHTIQERMARHKVPGVSIALIEDGKLILAKGYGVLKAGTNIPVTAKTQFQAASISKPFTALGIMALVKKGILDLDTDVNDYLKTWQIPRNAFTKNEKVTIRRLLSHTAGLTDGNGFPGYKVGDELPTLVEILKGKSLRVNSKPVTVGEIPGRYFQYSGGGYQILQLLIEETAGKPFEDYMSETILQPLGMLDSSFKYPTTKERLRVTASAHNKDQVVPNKWHIYPEKAAAALWSTPTDLAKVLVEIYECAYTANENYLTKIIGEKLCKDLLEGKEWPLKSGSTRGMGLGFQVATKPFGKEFHHGGSNEGVMCNFRGLHSRGKLFGTVVMTNSDKGYHVIDEIEKTFDDIAGLNPHDPVKRQIANIDYNILKLRIGSIYKNEKMTLTVIENNGGLAMIDSRDSPPDPLEIYPESDTVFFDLKGGKHTFSESDYTWTTPGKSPENIVFKKVTQRLK